MIDIINSLLHTTFGINLRDHLYHQVQEVTTEIDIQFWLKLEKEPEVQEAPVQNDLNTVAGQPDESRETFNQNDIDNDDINSYKEFLPPLL